MGRQETGELCVVVPTQRGLLNRLLAPGCSVAWNIHPHNSKTLTHTHRQTARSQQRGACVRVQRRQSVVYMSMCPCLLTSSMALIGCFIGLKPTHPAFFFTQSSTRTLATCGWSCPIRQRGGATAADDASQSDALSRAPPDLGCPLAKCTLQQEGIYICPKPNERKKEKETNPPRFSSAKT